MNRRLPFRLETRDRKLLGVCAGMARSLHVDPVFVRLAWVAVPLLTFVSVSQALLAYLVCGLIGAALGGRRSSRSDYDRMDEGRGSSISDLREKLDRTDRQMMAIDQHLHTSQNNALAREIEALRKEKA